jgi:hypothetical protein
MEGSMELRADAPPELVRLVEEIKQGKRAAARGDSDECWTHFDRAELFLQAFCFMRVPAPNAEK